MMNGEILCAQDCVHKICYLYRYSANALNYIFMYILLYVLFVQYIYGNLMVITIASSARLGSCNVTLTPCQYLCHF